MPVTFHSQAFYTGSVLPKITPLWHPGSFRTCKQHHSSTKELNSKGSYPKEVGQLFSLKKKVQGVYRSELSTPIKN